MRLSDFLDWAARERPAIECAIQGPRRITYGEAAAATDRLVDALTEAGVRPGDRFAFLAKNSIELVIGYLAASKSGAVIVPLNYRLAAAELQYVIADAEATVVIAQAEFAPGVESIRGELPNVTRFVVIGDAGLAGWERYEDWQTSARTGGPPAPVPSDPDADYCQMYTSGTTGRPKGAVLSHRGVVINALQCRTALPVGASPGDRMLIVMPIFHAGSASQVWGAIAGLATMVLHEDFDPVRVVRALSEENIFTVSMVPAMIRACLQLVPDVAERRYDSVKAFFYGASPIDSETLRSALATFGCGLHQAYGMTEASPVLTVLTPEDHERALRERPDLLLSAGRPVVGTEIRIVDAEDRPVAAGIAGEVVARGPQIMKEYWKQPAATAKALAGGWYHTGDIGVLDAEGYLFLRDRMNDMIVSGGENIYPREIEEALFQHSAVADAAVIGVPDDRFGERPIAFIVLRLNHRATAEELETHCRSRVAGYKLPREIRFLDALPRNPTGKVLKRVLREPFWADRTRRVS